MSTDTSSIIYSTFDDNDNDNDINDDNNNDSDNHNSDNYNNDTYMDNIYEKTYESYIIIEDYIKEYDLPFLTRYNEMDILFEIISNTNRKKKFKPQDQQDH